MMERGNTKPKVGEMSEIMDTIWRGSKIRDGDELDISEQAIRDADASFSVFREILRQRIKVKR